jgi:hypothetical protein
MRIEQLSVTGRSPRTAGRVSGLQALAPLFHVVNSPNLEVVCHPTFGTRLAIDNDPYLTHLPCFTVISMTNPGSGLIRWMILCHEVRKKARQTARCIQRRVDRALQTTEKERGNPDRHRPAELN